MDVSNFVCCICHNIPETVVESGCCHSLFCWDCVVKRDIGPCPCCKNILEPERCNENVAIQKLLANVPIPCPYDGCRVNVTPSTVKAHTAMCEYATVVCPNSELCGFLTRSELPAHLREDCVYRQVHCHSCEAVLPVFQLQAHLEQDCGGVIVRCTNNCSSEGIQRANLARHLSELCPNAPVPCPFALHGCDHVMPRSKIESHLASDVGKHLMAVTSLVETQQREIDQLREQVRTFQVAPAPAAPVLTAAALRECLCGLVAGYVEDCRPIIHEFARVVRLRMRWSSLAWFLLFWVCMMCVPFFMRVIALVYASAWGYNRFIAPHKRYLKRRSPVHLAAVNCLYIYSCIVVMGVCLVLF